MPKRNRAAAPCRLLIVEDDWFILEGTADQARELKLDVAGTAQTIVEAVALLDEDVDAVLLDMRLREGFTFEFADLLRQQGIPFLFMSGYSQPLAARFKDTPLLMKPFSTRDLKAALAAVMPPQCFPGKDAVPACAAL